MQGFGQDPCLSRDGHEVGIAAPAWHDVEVKVLVDAGTGALTQIHAEVESVGTVDLADRGDGSLGQSHQLQVLFGGQIRKG